MFKKILIPIVLAMTLTFSVSGCNEQARTYTVNAAIIGSQLIDLDKQFDTAVSEVNTINVFDTDEKAQLELVKTNLNRLRQTVRDLIQRNGGVAQVLINAEQVRYLYQQGATSYLTARSIIAGHWQQLSTEQQQELRRFDQQANALNEAIIRIKDSPQTQDITPIIRDVLTVGAATAKILLATGVL